MAALLAGHANNLHTHMVVLTGYPYITLGETSKFHSWGHQIAAEVGNKW